MAALVNRLEGERIGLIAFAGQAVVKCPLTVDYDAFRRSLDELDPTSAPRGGTAIGDAIRKALEVFQARADRDQAILLITDGDDQQSYPLEAATVAAEHHVTIFTVGLGDADHGARIPQAPQPNRTSSTRGHQVWSKLDGSLLKEIALKTSGVYVPVGTRAYDLGELYAKYLQGRRGSEEQKGKRFGGPTSSRSSSRWPCCPSGRRVHASLCKGREVFGSEPDPPATRRKPRARAAQPPLPVSAALLLAVSLAGISRADNPTDAVREGLHCYSKGEFEKARDKFAAAREQFDSARLGQSRDCRVRSSLCVASQGRRGASPGMVPKSGAGARQGPGRLGPLQPGNACGGRSPPDGRRGSRKRGRPTNARKSSTS